MCDYTSFAKFFRSFGETFSVFWGRQGETTHGHEGLLCRRLLLCRVEGARSRLLGPGRAVPNVNNEITVACSRGHSQLDNTRLGAPLARGAEAPEVVRAQGHMHSQQTALQQRKSRGPVRTAFRNIIFLSWRTTTTSPTLTASPKPVVPRR